MKAQLLLLVLFLTLTACSTTLKFPQEEASTLKLCFLGDVGKASSAQLLVSRALKHEKCHEIFFLGDLIYKEGIRSAQDPKFESHFFGYYRQLTQQDHRPRLHMVLGNHDYLGTPDAWIDLALVHPEINFPARYYWQKKEDLCLVTLDSNGKDFSAQSEWLKKKRPDWKECRYLLALAHHNLVSSGPSHHHASKELTEFYENNVLGKFDFLITGHEHVVENMGESKGTTLLISGAGGAVASGYRPGYITVEKKNEEATSLDVKLKTIGKDGVVDVKSFVKAI